MTQPLDSSQDMNQGAQQTDANVGPMLRALREARNLSLSDVSARLKFSVRQIKALEDERWESLPQGMPLRGMVKNYARFLETDVEALLDGLERQIGVSGPAAVSINQTGRYSEADLPLHGEQTGRPWGWLVIILLVLFVAIFYAIERAWIPESWLWFDWLKSIQK
jgi:cytoskeleton protein RodZ